MPAASKKHQIRRVVQAVHETPWAITQEKLAAIVDLLDRRAEGQLSAEEIESRLGGIRGRRRDEDEDSYRVTPDGIAVIPLYGILGPRMNLLMDYSGGTSTQQFAAAVEGAAADPDVRAIVLDVDSPGGDVLGTAEAAAIVEAAAKQKEFWAVATGQMCSAAYYIGAAAGKGRLAASPSSLIGSIGVFTVHTDYSAQETTSGVRRTVIHSAGSDKTAGTPYRTLSQNDSDQMRVRINDYHSQFVAAIAAYRGVSTETVAKAFGNGDSFVAPRAREVGLIDRVATLSQIVGELGEKYRVTSSGSVRDRPGMPRFGGEGEILVSGSAKENSVDKIKKRLVQLGLVAEDASEEIVKAVCAAWFAARGQKQPDGEDAVVAALDAKPTGAAAPTPPVAPTPPAQPSAEEQVKADRERARQIRARGRLLGMSEDAIEAQVDSGATLGAALDVFTANLAKENTPARRIETGRTATEKWQDVAVEALVHRAGIKTEKPISAAAQEFRFSSLLDIARESLRLRTGRAAVGSREDIALAALGDQETLARVFAADVPYHTPGDFPSLLSGLTNKALDAAPRYVGTTFQFWAHQRQSVPDFKPATLHRVGEFGEFPVVPDGADFEQSKTTEEATWIAVDSYGDEFGFTPRMMVDDDLGALMDALGDKQAAHDYTVNRLCVNLLVGNPTLWDGVALFNLASHSNLIAAGGGGVPSVTELGDIRALLRKQTGPMGKRKLNLPVYGLLIPEELETTTEQLLSPNVVVVPTTDATGNNFRGRVQWWVDPMIGESSTAYWYAFADPRLARSIVYAYQTGYERMQKRDYYNPKNNCRMFQFEGRFAAGVNNWRGVARNDGS